MILKNSTFKELSDEIIKKNHNVIIFGAGMIGTITTPEILKQYGAEKFIDFYVDNDQSKWDKTVPENEKKIYSPEKLKNISSDGYILLITISRFSDVIKQLDSFDNLKNMTCYIVPMMCISNFKPGEIDGTVKDSDAPLIPKIIHYMWLGKNKIPESLQYCIDSWKKYCPDYEIKQWDESNYDIGKNLYMKQAYENKMYGFVSDFARLDILYNYGGIYLDTDVELIKNLDDMLYQSAFCCVEKWQTVATGGGCGAVKNSIGIKTLLDERMELKFINNEGNLNINTCGYYDTKTLIKYGYKITGHVQKILDLNIYPYEYFIPYDYASGKTDMTDHTYAIHHYSGSWMDDKMHESNKKTSKEFDRLLKIANCEV